MIKKAIVFILISGALLISNSQPGDSLQITAVDLVEASPDSGCVISISYPKIVDINNPARQNKINEYLKEKFTTAKQGFNIDECDSLYNFNIDVTFKIKYNSRPFVSLVLNHYEYTGGAHPNYASIGYNIETATGYVYEFGDIFEPQYFDTLSAMIETEILENYDANSLQEAGLFEKEIEITTQQDFYVDNGFIVIQFDPYEIAPYAMGSIEIPLLFDDIWPFIKGDIPFEIIKEK